MLILGLHFGHDANISLIKDGKILCCIEKERINKNKHTIGLHASDIKMVLEDCGFDIKDIDFCSVTSSQCVEYILFDENLTFKFSSNFKDKTSLHYSLGLNADELKIRNVIMVFTSGFITKTKLYTLKIKKH